MELFILSYFLWQAWASQWQSFSFLVMMPPSCISSRHFLSFSASSRWGRNTCFDTFNISRRTQCHVQFISKRHHNNATSRRIFTLIWHFQEWLKAILGGQFFTLKANRHVRCLRRRLMQNRSGGFCRDEKHDWFSQWWLYLTSPGEVTA